MDAKQLHETSLRILGLKQKVQAVKKYEINRMTVSTQDLELLIEFADKGLAVEVEQPTPTKKTDRSPHANMGMITA